MSDESEIDAEVAQYAKTKKRVQAATGIGTSLALLTAGLLHWLPKTVQHGVFLGTCIFIIVVLATDPLLKRWKDWRSGSGRA